MQKTVVINVVGLTHSLIGKHTPHLKEFTERSKNATIGSVFPAVTCSAQSTYVTGSWPEDHGIVGNGWYDKEDAEIKFWKQSNKLVKGEKVWDKARKLDKDFTCAKMFWWYNMYSTADYSVTPRPMYPADGRKLPDVYAQPASLRDELQEELGQFPLFNFWGPNSSIKSSQWIAESAKKVEEKYNPTLSLVYLPHLDYCLQQKGPDTDKISKELAEIDNVCGDLIRFFEEKNARVILLSEYGINKVSRPVHLNRVLRDSKFISVRNEMGRELLDAGASKAFAVADHQVAHIYINDKEQKDVIKSMLEKVEGVERILDDEGKKEFHINHDRAGDLIAIAEEDAFFTYYYWLNDQKAPDFAHCVDIHRKPGYDPAELFLDPNIKYPKLKVGSILLKKNLGFRYLMDVIPLEADLVKGSHGRPASSRNEEPVLISNKPDLLVKDHYQPVDVGDVILNHLTSQ
ncbi:MAG: nucleotide pyrophosphatase/phosphodiesterase family protein [Balneolales bacterium]